MSLERTRQMWFLVYPLVLRISPQRELQSATWKELVIYNSNCKDFNWKFLEGESQVPWALFFIPH